MATVGPMTKAMSKSEIMLRGIKKWFRNVSVFLFANEIAFGANKPTGKEAVG